MATPLTEEEVIRYTPIIDGILSTADLETITRKKIVHGMQMSLGGIDLSDQKAAIKALIISRFDKMNENKPAAAAEDPDASRGKRSATSDGSDGGETDPSESPEPARKKVKRSSSAEDADARLAAQLQAEENSLARSRKTRGGSDKAKTSRKKSAPRKKSSKKVSAEDDSDLENSEAAPKRKAGGGFQKPFVLSATLSELCGETQLSRPQVVKKLWEHIKANDLQDPKDRRQIICDEKMMAVFKQAKVSMFGMNKEIGNHLYPVGEE